MSQLTHLISLETHKTFIRLQNTNEDIFNETWKISVLPLKVHSTKTLFQKAHEDIVKINMFLGFIKIS